MWPRIFLFYSYKMCTFLLLLLYSVVTVQHEKFKFPFIVTLPWECRMWNVFFYCAKQLLSTLNFIIIIFFAILIFLPAWRLFANSFGIVLVAGTFRPLSTRESVGRISGVVGILYKIGAQFRIPDREDEPLLLCLLSHTHSPLTYSLRHSHSIFFITVQPT